MNDFTTIAKTTDLKPGRGRAFPLGNRLVALFYDGTSYSAINDFCPHMGASLADGDVENGIVTCPWHAWRFCVSDGTWCDNPRIRTDSYDVRVLGDEIQVRLRVDPAKQPASA